MNVVVEKKATKKSTGNQKNAKKPQEVQKNPIIKVLPVSKKETNNDVNIEKAPESSTKLDQVKTANIKNMLGLNF